MELHVKKNTCIRRHVALAKGTRTLERKEKALGTATAKVIADKKVQPPCHLTFYSLAFPFLIAHLSLCANLRLSYGEALS